MILKLNSKKYIYFKNPESVNGRRKYAPGPIQAHAGFVSTPCLTRKVAALQESPLWAMNRDHMCILLPSGIKKLLLYIKWLFAS